MNSQSKPAHFEYPDSAGYPDGSGFLDEGTAPTLALETEDAVVSVDRPSADADSELVVRRDDEKRVWAATVGGPARCVDDSVTAVGSWKRRLDARGPVPVGAVDRSDDAGNGAATALPDLAGRDEPHHAHVVAIGGGATQCGPARTSSCKSAVEPEVRTVQVLPPSRELVIVPPRPTATTVEPSAAIRWRNSPVPGVRGVQFTPSGELRIVPARPHARNCVSLFTMS